jgi:hypothetical protein
MVNEHGWPGWPGEGFGHGDDGPGHDGPDDGSPGGGPDPDADGGTGPDRWDPHAVDDPARWHPPQDGPDGPDGPDDPGLADDPGSPADPGFVDPGFVDDNGWHDGSAWHEGSAWHDGPGPAEHDASAPGAEHPGGAAPAPVEAGTGPVGADPDAVPEHDLNDADAPFPPPVHVGALPEPIDGFPWIDTGTLGVTPADPDAGPPIPAGLDGASLDGANLDGANLDGAGLDGAGVDSAELAAYAQTDLPPGVDPWAALAESDDPATSALARWWAPPA